MPLQYVDRSGGLAVDFQKYVDDALCLGGDILALGWIASAKRLAYRADVDSAAASMAV